MTLRGLLDGGVVARVTAKTRGQTYDQYWWLGRIRSEPPCQVNLGEPQVSHVPSRFRLDITADRLTRGEAEN